MSKLELTCGVCGKTTSSFFIVVGSEMVCTMCKFKKKPKNNTQIQKPRIFVRYVCVVHNCGTYNINAVRKHLMDDCEFKEQETLGIIRPATFGGYNGDISRKYFLGINEMDRLKTNLSNYKRFAIINYKLYDKRTSYSSRKYHRKHLRFLNIPSNPDFHKFDELFKKLKFNLKVYLESKSQFISNPILSPEERKKLYYKNLVQNFQIQVTTK